MCDGCEMYPIIGTRYKVYFIINYFSVQSVKILIYVKNVKNKINMNMLCLK